MSFWGMLSEIGEWKDANNECGRVKAEFIKLDNGLLRPVTQELTKKEWLHLRHTVFRINSLMYLYSKLIRGRHDTRVGVLCGVVTHLLDYFFDHCNPLPEQVIRIREIIFLEKDPCPDEYLESALHELCRILWACIPNPQSVKNTLQEMLTTQELSLAQNSKSSNLEEREMSNLTETKGFHSLCLYFSIVNPNFTHDEASHLISFGLYMQYMDDLEDFYEDKTEKRQSPIVSIDLGFDQATRLLFKSEKDLADYYDNTSYKYNFVWDKVLFFHRSMLFACWMRERTMGLPRWMRKIIFISKEFISEFIPFIYVAPVDWIE